MAELIEVGSDAPEFESLDQDGNSIKLSSFKGMPVVLYFYPRDDTPGCTTEACNFRDNFAEFEKHGVKVLGISVDSQNSHKKFEKKYGLNFTLVVDNSKQVSEKYGTLGDRSAKRVTYIIGPDGKIKYVYPKVTPKEHAIEVLSKLRDLNLIN